MIKRILILAGCLCMAGCMPHFKDMDSYHIMFRDKDEKPNGKGDPYTFGGIGEGSGGLMPRQTYATDSKEVDARDDTTSLGEIDKDRTSTPDGGNMKVMGALGTQGEVFTGTPSTQPPTPVTGPGTGAAGDQVR